MTTASVEDIEMSLLLEGIRRQYGHDFRAWAQPPLHARVRELVDREGLHTISALQDRVLHDRQWLARVLYAIASRREPMFARPELFLALRTRVVPVLRTWPFVRVWHVGCSTGEAAWSLAVLLEEEGLTARTRAFATDIDESTLEIARLGAFPMAVEPTYAANHAASGGKGPFSRHYDARGDMAFLDAGLHENLTFDRHVPGTDASFNEFHLVVCRGIMRDWEPALQRRVHHLVHDSLARFGVLVVDDRDDLQGADPRWYEALDEGLGLFRKVR